MMDVPTQKYVNGNPTCNVTFIFNLEEPNKSTYLVDFDKRLHLKKEDWEAEGLQVKLLMMIDHLKDMLPQIMINTDEDFETQTIKKEPTSE